MAPLRGAASAPPTRLLLQLLWVLVLTVGLRRGAHGLEPQCRSPEALPIPSDHSSLPGSSSARHDPDAGGSASYPDATAGFSVNDLWTFHFDCDSLLAAGPRPIPDAATWAFLRGAYQGAVGPARSSLPEPAAPGHGFAVPFEVRQTPDGKGRGVFAARDIPQGALVYAATRYMAHFARGGDFRRFLQALPRDWACDVLMWAYVEDLKGRGVVIGLDLDEGSLLNDGGATEGNVGCDAEQAPSVPHGCDLHYFALRDIRAGEELLCVYADFDVPDGWGLFGL